MLRKYFKDSLEGDQQAASLKYLIAIFSLQKHYTFIHECHHLQEYKKTPELIPALCISEHHLAQSTTSTVTLVKTE